MSLNVEWQFGWALRDYSFDLSYHPTLIKDAIKRQERDVAGGMEPREAAIKALYEVPDPAYDGPSPADVAYYLAERLAAEDGICVEDAYLAIARSHPALVRLDDLWRTDPARVERALANITPSEWAQIPMDDVEANAARVLAEVEHQARAEARAAELAGEKL